MHALCGTVRYPQDRRVRVQYSTSSDLLPSILHKQDIVVYPIRVAVALRCHRGFASVESQSGVSSIRRGSLLGCGSIRVQKDRRTTQINDPTLRLNALPFTLTVPADRSLDGVFCGCGGRVLGMIRYQSHPRAARTRIRHCGTIWLPLVRRADIIISYHTINHENMYHGRV